MLLDKRKYLFMTFIFLLLLFTGCKEKEVLKPKCGGKPNTVEIVKLDGKTIKSATVSKVGENMLDIMKPHISYNHENSIELKTFVNAIQRAEKIDGVVDVTTPDYLLILTFEDKTISKYSLWLREDGGSIMNENNTHFLYTLPSNIIGDLNKYVKRHKQ